jgi:anti-sigma-K factor RskA
MNEPHDPAPPISDEELHSLLGPYALDAVEPEEHEQVDAYLRRNSEARREITRFEDVLAALATAEASEPPPELWTRVAQRLQAPRPIMLSDAGGGADAGGDAETSPATDPPGGDPTGEPATVVELAARRASRRDRWRSALLGAAAVVALAVAAVAVLTRPGDAPGSLTELAQAAEAADGSRIATLQGEAGTARLVIDAAGNGYLQAEGLERLEPGQTYQLWSLDGATPVSLGVLGPDPTTAAVPAAAVRMVALSVEAAGGGASPSLPPVAVGEVRPG